MRSSCPGWSSAAPCTTRRSRRACGGISTRDWLVTPQQSLASVTAGAVYHDGLGQLEPVRQALAWYPRDLWLWQLAGQWRRIGQEEPFCGRADEVGDDLGRRVLVGRLAGT